MECASDEQDDVVDHVAVGDEVEEGRQWLDSVISHMLELDDSLFAKFIVNHRDGERWRLVGEKLAIVGALQVEFEICKKENLLL